MIAEEFHVPKSTISGIYTRRDSLKRIAEQQPNPNAKRGRLNTGGSKIDSIVFEWYCRARFEGRHLTGTSIKAFAVRASNILGITDFKASNGWLYKFLARHLLELKPKGKESVCSALPNNHSGEIDSAAGNSGSSSSSSSSNGEHNSGERGVISDMYGLGDLMSAYTTRDIYACAIVPIMWRSLTSHTATSTPDVSAHERMTIVLTVNALGDKLEPFVISRKRLASWKLENDSSNVAMDCYRDKNSWVTCGLFQIYVYKLNYRMKAANRHVLLILDSAPFNCDLQLSNVKLHFLNKSSVRVSSNPAANGLARCFQVLYKIKLLEYVRGMNQSNIDCRNVLPCINWYFVPNWFRDVWNSIDAATIVSCFNNSHPIVQLDEAIAKLGLLCGDIGSVSLDDIVLNDFSVRTHEPLSEDWEELLLQRCQHHRNTTASDSDASSDDCISISDGEDVETNGAHISDSRAIERIDVESIAHQQHAWRLIRGVIHRSSDVSSDLKSHVKALDEFLRHRWVSIGAAAASTQRTAGSTGTSVGIGGESSSSSSSSSSRIDNNSSSSVGRSGDTEASTRISLDSSVSRNQDAGSSISYSDNIISGSENETSNGVSGSDGRSAVSE
jgi:hypothetical protein